MQRKRVQYRNEATKLASFKSGVYHTAGVQAEPFLQSAGLGPCFPSGQLRQRAPDPGAS